MEPVLLGLAPLVRELVGLLLTEELKLCVLLGVLAPVPVPELLGVAVCVGEGVKGGVVLPERDLVLLEEALAPGDRGAVGEAERELLRLELLDGVACGVPLPV